MLSSPPTEGTVGSPTESLHRDTQRPPSSWARGRSPGALGGAEVAPKKRAGDTSWLCGMLSCGSRPPLGIGGGGCHPPPMGLCRAPAGQECLAQRTSKRHSLPERCWFHSRLRKRRARGARGAWAHSPSTPSASYAPAGSPTHKIVPPGAARGRLGCRGVKYDMRWGAGNGH